MWSAGSLATCWDSALYNVKCREPATCCFGFAEGGSHPEQALLEVVNAMFALHGHIYELHCVSTVLDWLHKLFARVRLCNYEVSVRSSFTFWLWASSSEAELAFNFLVTCHCLFSDCTGLVKVLGTFTSFRREVCVCMHTQKWRAKMRACKCMLTHICVYMQKFVLCL